MRGTVGEDENGGARPSLRNKDNTRSSLLLSSLGHSYYSKAVYTSYYCFDYLPKTDIRIQKKSARFFLRTVCSKNTTLSLQNVCLQMPKVAIEWDRKRWRCADAELN